MKNSIAKFLIFSFLISTMVSGYAETLVGKMDGDVSVDNAGAANYSVPLILPPGTAGLMPELSISYSSRNGRGVLGDGFSLSGLSKITRARASFYHDGFVDGVDYDDNDRFLLDGQRLKLVSGTYGAAGSEYRTEIESFSRIVAVGQTGSGPASFRVHRKDGRVFEYGNTADSFVQAGQTSAYSWAVNRISDEDGNYIIFEYDAQSGQHLIERIEYTGNTNGLAPYNVIDFVYESRPDTRPAYVYGSLLELTKRLQKAVVSCEGNSIREYRFEYTTSAAGESLLESIQTFFGSDSLPKTTFEYSPVSPNSGFTYHHMTEGICATHDVFVDGDFNGDGLDDLLLFDYHASGALKMGLSPGDGTFLFQSLSKSFERGNTEIFSGDFDGDGNDDIACFEDPAWWSSPDRFEVGMSNGDGTFSFTNLPNVKVSGTRFLFGDFNADGWDDVACFVHNNYLRIGLSNGDGSFSFTNSTKRFETTASTFLLGDFNGDGMADLACFEHTALANVGDNASVGISNGDGTFSFTAIPIGFQVASSKFVVGDYNGDGKDDLACMEHTSWIWTGDSFGLGMSNGDGTFSFTEQPISLSVGDESLFFSGDFNGDGKTDLIGHEDRYDRWSLLSKDNESFINQPLPNKYLDEDDTQLAGDFNGDGLMDLLGFHSLSRQWANYSIGDGTFTNRNLSPPWNRLYDYSKFMSGDFNGDGSLDFVAILTDSGEPWVALSANEKVYLTRITEEYQSSSQHGEVIELNYCPITDTNVYVKESGSAYPIKDIIDPIYVVSSLGKSDGLGALYYTDHTYAGARVHKNGRGFLGFHMFESYDRQTELSVIETLAQDFPFTGKVLRKELYDNSASQLLEQTDNIWLFDAVQGGTLFPYLAKTTTQKWELGDPSSPYQSVTVRNWFDGQDTSINPPEQQPETLPVEITYGNLVQSVTDYGNDPAKTVQYSYVSPDTTRWLVNLPFQSTTIHQQIGSPSITNTATYIYYPATRRIYQMVGEPGHPVLERTSTFTHDDFGNISTETRSSPSVATRIVQNNTYDSNGRFVIESRNTLNHLTQMDYDPALGVVTNIIDPNGLQTTRQIDALGHPVFEQYPDGTTTTSTYTWDFNKTFSVPKAQGGSVTQRSVFRTLEETSGQPPVTTWADLKGRTIRTENLSMDGTKTINRETGYDHIGRLIAVSEPYFSGETKSYTRSQHDALGRVVQTIAPDGTVTENLYLGLTTQVVEDSNLRTGGSTPKYQVHTSVKNAKGQVIQIADAMSNTVTYTYNAAGNLTQTQDPDGNTTEIEYDLRGNKIRQDDPDMGVWEYEHNALDQLVSQIDANANRIEYAYDLLDRPAARTNRLMTASGLELESTASWDYDGTTEGDRLGMLRLEEHRDGNGILINRKRYAYDQYSRPMLELMNYDQKWYYTALEYDSFGRVETVHRYWRPKGKEGIDSNLDPQWNVFGTENIYNERGALLEVKDLTGHTWWETEASDYDAYNRLAKYQYGNGLTTTNDFNPMTGRIEGLGISNTEQGVSNYEFEYDRLGNLTQRAQSRPSMTTLTETCTYDALNRLTASQVQGQTLQVCSYDSMGNILSRTGVGNYTYGSARPHAVTSAGDCDYFYDSNGNIVRRDKNAQYEFTAKWNSFNKPVSLFSGLKGSEFSYNVDGRRTKQIIFEDLTNVTKKVYATPAYEMKEVLLNPAETNRVLWEWEMDFCRIYVDTPAGKIGIYQEKGSTNGTGAVSRSYMHKDHLGSIVAISDDLTNITFMSFDAWGNRRDPDDWTPAASQSEIDNLKSALTDRGFTGHEQLDHLQLVHMNGRVFDPTIGRFLSPDPLIQAPENLQSYNRYSYVWNNPLSHTDPSGFQTKTTEDKASQSDIASGNAEPIAAKHIAKADTVGTDVSANQLAGNGATADPPQNYSGGDFSDAFSKMENSLVLNAETYGSIRASSGLDRARSGLARFTYRLDETVKFIASFGTDSPDHSEAGYLQRRNFSGTVGGAPPLLTVPISRLPVAASKAYTSLSKTRFGRPLVKMGERIGIYGQKVGRGGRPQPSSVITGRYVDRGKTIGSKAYKAVSSSYGRFTTGVGQGIAESQGAIGASPDGTAGKIGYALGSLLGGFL